MVTVANGLSLLSLSPWAMGRSYLSPAAHVVGMQPSRSLPILTSQSTLTTSKAQKQPGREEIRAEVRDQGLPGGHP